MRTCEHLQVLSKHQYACVHVCVKCVQARRHKPDPTSAASLRRILSGPVITATAKIMPWYVTKCELEEVT